MDDGSNSIRMSPGVQVFGSAVVRVTPDRASIAVALTRTEQKPESAFARAREGAQAVTAFLHKAGIKDFGSSRVSLSQSFRYVNGENRFTGYTSRIEFNVLLQDLDRLESVLSGLLSAGVNELTSVTFQTSRLKELRADARRRAVAAAREKAELYCQAAGVSVGNVLAIEDVNPDTLAGRNEGHNYRETTLVEDTEPTGIDPGAITVTAAVRVVYGITGA